jgi:hypothetical protein
MATFPTTTSGSCIQVISVPPGGSVSIPAGSTIISSDATDNSLLTSTCSDLEQQLANLGPSVCYSFRWESVAFVGPLNDAYFKELIISSTVYDLKGPYVAALVGMEDYPMYNDQAVYLGNAITKNIPTPIVKVMVTCELGSGTKKVVVSIPQSLGVPSVRIINPDSQGGGDGLYIQGSLLTGCTCNSDPSL